jgi:tetratricopeptide (TPR) repeat protein
MSTILTESIKIDQIRCMDHPAARVREISITLRGSALGPESSLPSFTHLQPRGLPRVSAQASPDMRERVERGRLTGPLPYGVSSDYDRTDRDVELPAIELSNGLLTATVLPTLGGRVWSLVDHGRDRELLFVNPRLRFANFGLTDAWFAGGIEWNLGSTGHATTSTRPMHTAVLDTPLGPVVRMWEWERTRDLVLQVDLWLAGERLMASTRVVNPDPEPKPLYYWTNIAAPETSGTRVLVPATHAWRTDYTGVLDRVSVPRPAGDVDISRPSSSTYAADYFYEVAHDRGRFVCAVEPDGSGLAQTSTDALHGRKLFLWGTGPGGTRWQEWLSTPDTRYLEIQAGVCTTQMEHDLLAGHEVRSWTESFAALDLDPRLVSDGYAAASAAARDAVHATSPPEWLEEQHATWLAEVAELDPGDAVVVASGWGHAELVLRGQDAPAGVSFPAVQDQSADLARFAAGDPAALGDMPLGEPTIPPVSERWLERFADTRADAVGWWPHYALATAHHVRGDREAARAAYEQSIDLTPTAVALRGLALLTDDVDVADSLYAKACRLSPDDRRLVTERLVALLAAGRAEAVVTIVGSLSESIRGHGRTRLLLAEALADSGDTQGAFELLADLEIPDFAEGGTSTALLWERVRPGVPVPQRLDFRMAPSVAQ